MSLPVYQHCERLPRLRRRALPRSMPTKRDYDRLELGEKQSKVLRRIVRIATIDEPTPEQIERLRRRLQSRMRERLGPSGAGRRDLR